MLMSYNLCLATAGYYRKFVKYFSKIAKLLSADLVRYISKKDNWQPRLWV